MNAQNDPFAFAQKLLDLLRFGGFTATYKYAVLLGLMDLCVEFDAPGQKGAPAMITATELAAKIIEIYWPQTWPFNSEVLQQSSGKGQAKIVSLISDWRSRHAPAGESLARARLERPAAFASLVRSVEWKLVQMPLPKLQRIGQREDPFIYEIGWRDDITKGEFNGGDFNNRIDLQHGIAGQLVRVSPLLRPLIHREWAAMVARINDLPAHRLEAFLFVADDQIDTTPVRGPLLELQGSRCFYCDAKINSDAQVDHFIARARHLDHGIENLVVAHQQCNGSKSDFLAHTDHLLAWAERFEQHGDELATIAAQTAWARDAGRTRNIVRTIYSQVARDAALWRRTGRGTVRWDLMNPHDRQSAFARIAGVRSHPALG